MRVKESHQHLPAVTATLGVPTPASGTFLGLTGPRRGLPSHLPSGTPLSTETRGGGPLPRYTGHQP